MSVTDFQKYQDEQDEHWRQERRELEEYRFGEWTDKGED